MIPRQHIPSAHHTGQSRHNPQQTKHPRTRHSRESGNPGTPHHDASVKDWIPAFAGMTRTIFHGLGCSGSLYAMAPARHSHQAGRGSDQAGQKCYQAGRRSYQVGRGSDQAGLKCYQAGRRSYQVGRGSDQAGLKCYQVGRGSDRTGLKCYQLGRGSDRAGLKCCQLGRGSDRTVRNSCHTMRNALQSNHLSLICSFSLVPKLYLETYFSRCAMGRTIES